MLRHAKPAGSARQAGAGDLGRATPGRTDLARARISGVRRPSYSLGAARAWPELTRSRMIGRSTAASSEGALRGAAGSDQPSGSPKSGDGSAAGTEAVTTQCRKMSFSDGVSTAQTSLSDNALPELPASRTDVACLSSSPETSAQLGAPALVQPTAKRRDAHSMDFCAGDAAALRENYVDAIKFYTHALTPSESSVEVRWTVLVGPHMRTTFSFGSRADLSKCVCSTCPQILCKRANAMVLFAHHTRDRSASQLDEDVVAGPDAETLAMMALRDAKKILLLDSTWYDSTPRYCRC
jgi:hypothetical protein